MENLIIIKIKSSHFEINLTTADIDIDINGCRYFSGLKIYSIFQENMSAGSNSYVVINIHEKFTKDIIKSKEIEINCEIFRIEYSDSSNHDFNSCNNQKTSQLFSGIVSKIEFCDKNNIKLYLSSYAAKLNKEVGEFYSPLCRAEFGDKRCAKDLSSYTFLYKIKSVISSFQFEIDSIHPDQYFIDGYLKFESGLNKDFKSKIINHENNIITLLSHPRNPVQIEDEISLVVACSKTLQACKNFENIINFRGEPFIKKIDF